MIASVVASCTVTSRPTPTPEPLVEKPRDPAESVTRVSDSARTEISPVVAVMVDPAPTMARVSGVKTLMTADPAPASEPLPCWSPPPEAMEAPMARPVTKSPVSISPMPSASGSTSGITISIGTISLSASMLTEP